MTISTQQSTQTVFGNGVTSVFNINFTPDTAENIAIIYTNAAGAQTTLSPTQYTISIPSPPIGELWPTGFTVTYPISGAPIANGTSLTVQRLVPLQQNVVLENQGNFYPQAVEEALDLLEMQIQQNAARTGQIRGTWVSGVAYNFGDIVQDGANGSNSGSYYTCAIANTSSVWVTDLAAGDWNLSLPATLPTTPLPLSIANGGTGQTTAGAALNALGGIALSGNNIFTGTNSFIAGSIAVPTASPGDSSTKAASTSFVATSFAPLDSPALINTPTAPTQTAGDDSNKIATTAYIDRGSSGASMVLLATAIANNTASVVFTDIPSVYDQYILTFTNVVPTTDGQALALQLSVNNGVSYIAAHYYWTNNIAQNGGTSGVNHGTDDTQFQISGAVSNAYYGAYGEVVLILSQSSFANYVLSAGFSDSAALGRPSTCNGSGELAISSVVNAVKLAFASSIVSGKFALYGIRNT